MNMQNLAALAAIASNGNGGLPSLGSGWNFFQNQNCLLFFVFVWLVGGFCTGAWVELLLLPGIGCFSYTKFSVYIYSGVWCFFISFFARRRHCSRDAGPLGSSCR